MSLKPAPHAWFAALTVLTLTGSLAAAERRDGATPRATIALSPAETVTPLAAAVEPPRAWNDLGCVGCHGDDGIYRDEIKGALGKPVAQVARWIRNAPSIKPGTDMPSFEGQIDEPGSIALATWVMARAATLK